MPTTLFSLPSELRFRVYRCYATLSNYKSHTPTIIGDRLLLPPLLYASSEADQEIGQIMFDKLDTQFLRAKTMPGVVVNLHYRYLVDYLEALARDPMTSGGGKIKLVLVLTEARMTMLTATANAHEFSMWDFLGDLERIYGEGHRKAKISCTMRFNPPEVGRNFERSPSLDAIGGYRLERPDLAMRRIAKARAAVRQKVLRWK